MTIKNVLSRIVQLKKYIQHLNKLHLGKINIHKITISDNGTDIKADVQSIVPVEYIEIKHTLKGV